MRFATIRENSSLKDSSTLDCLPRKLASNLALSNMAKSQHGKTQASSSAVNAVAAPEKTSSSGAETGETGPPTPAAVKAAFSTILPVQQEKPVLLSVEGSVPTWLKGSLVRNGPGVFAKEHTHLFDGYAMLVKFEFANGSVATQQKFVQTESFKAFAKTGEPQFDEFGYHASAWKSIKQIAAGIFGNGPFITDNSSVNTCRPKGEEDIVTMTEVATGSYRVSPDLRTLSKVEHKDKLKGDLTTAHPVVYPDGKIYNLYTNLGQGRLVAEVDYSTGKRRKIADVKMDHPITPPWVHDLPGTEFHIIVPDTPVMFSLKGLVLRATPYINFIWDPKSQKTKFHLVNRHTGSVKTVEADFDYFTFHYGNAFESEDGQTVFLDCPVFEDPELVNSLGLEKMRSGEKSIADTPGMYSRISIPLNGGKATLKTLVPKNQCMYIELMRINPQYKFKDYQFVYGVTARLPTSYGNAVSKLDVKAGTAKQWFEPGCITTEPLMIPRPGATKEDDGVVTSLVTGANGKNFLLVLDAASFEEIARADLPYGITYGFHNQFYN